jgi:CheY-like chemotaxis protein
MNMSRILVVDDDPKLTALVSFILKRIGGFFVREENRPFAICTALEFAPDLIILDMDMPGTDGGDFAADLRQLPPFIRTPIIFLTALVARAENSRKGDEIFMAKPVDATLLVDTARRLVSAAPMRPIPRLRFLPRHGADTHRSPSLNL